MLNFVMIVLALYRYEKKEDEIHWGWFVSTSAMYITVLYGDMLHGYLVDSVQIAVKELAIRTVIVLVMTVACLVMAKVLKSRMRGN